MHTLIHASFSFRLLLFAVSVLLLNAQAISAEDSSAPQSESKPEIHWRTDYAQAQKDAADTHKPILLFFTGSDWCSVCKRLEAAVLHEAQIVSLIESQFIPVMLDYPKTFELDPALKAQNDQLNKRFRIRGYPTVIACVDEEMPFGLLLGYGGDRDKTIQELNSMAIAGEVLANLPDTFSLETTTDQPQLEKLVTHLPIEMLADKWKPYADRLVELTPEDSPSRAKVMEIHQQVVDLNDIKAWTSELNSLTGGRGLRGIEPSMAGRRGGQGRTPPDLIKALEFVDARLAESTGKPKKLEFLLEKKVQILATSGQWDEAIALMEEVSTKPWSGANAKTKLKREIALLLIRKGDCEKAIDYLTDYHADLVQQKRDEGIPLEIRLLQDFLFYGHPEITARYADEILAKYEKVPENFNYVYYAGSQAYRILGINLEKRALCLVNLSTMYNDTTMPRLNKAEAAICYRAAGLNDKADELISDLESFSKTDEPVPFGQEAAAPSNSLEQQIQEMTEVAKGSQIKSLRFLATKANEEGAKRLNLEADALELEGQPL